MTTLIYVCKGHLFTHKIVHKSFTIARRISVNLNINLIIGGASKFNTKLI